LSGASQSNPRHLFFLRIIFGISHLFFVIIFAKTRHAINSVIASQDKKQLEAAAVFDTFKGIIIRGLLIAAIHYKSGIIQPLVVSSAMGVMSIIENERMYDEICNIVPFMKKPNNKKIDW
jgi:hypothetical protein